MTTTFKDEIEELRGALKDIRTNPPLPAKGGKGPGGHFWAPLPESRIQKLRNTKKGKKK
jgi:hypothetical protein